MNPISTLGRPLDFRYATNAFIAGLTVAVTVFGSIARFSAGAKLGAALEWGGLASITVFLSWALCRELDPDHDRSAFLAAGIGLVLVWLAGPPDIWIQFWVLLTIRLINRTTGAAPTVIDDILILGMGGLFSLKWGGGVSLLTSIAFLVSGLVRPRDRTSLILSEVALAFAVGVFFYRPQPSPGPLTSASVFALVVCVLFTPVALCSSAIKCVGDRSGTPLNSLRVQSGQLWAMGVFVWMAIAIGEPGLRSSLPLGSAFVGAIGYLAFARIRTLLQRKGNQAN